jgi:hypothetical protein
VRFHAVRTRWRGRSRGATLCVSRDHADEQAERLRLTCTDGTNLVEVLGRDKHNHPWRVLVRWERPDSGFTGPFSGDRVWRRRPG